MAISRLSPVTMSKEENLFFTSYFIDLSGVEEEEKELSKLNVSLILYYKVIKLFFSR